MAQVASDSAFEMKATANYRRADCVGAGATGAQLVPGDDALAQGDDEYAVGDADVLAAATPRGNADGEWNAAVIFWDGGMFGSAASKYGDAKPKYDDAASKYLDAYEDYYVSAMGGYMDAYMEFDMLHMML